MKNKRAILLIAYGLFIAIMTGIFSKCHSQTPQEVYDLCVKLEIKHPEIVTAQSILETKWYKCDQCSLRYSNIFGFRRSDYATEENPLGYFKFADWKRCVLFYRNWQRRKYLEGDYYEFLQEIGYATNKEYINKLKSIKI